MAYFDVATLTADGDFNNRVTACHAVEDPTDPRPMVWTADHIWQIAAAPGFGDAYASAIVSGVPNPGRDPAVISDNQILAAVQAVGA
jgi:hypothetical protein